VIGAIIVPPFSDKLRKRKLFLVVAMFGCIPGLMGLTVSSDFTVLLISSSVLGFFLLGIGAPVGFQFTAEISAPTGESTSQGVILWVGQASGIAFIIAMNKVGMNYLMITFCILAVVATILAASLKESPAYPCCQHSKHEEYQGSSGFRRGQDHRDPSGGLTESV